MARGMAFFQDPRKKTEAKRSDRLMRPLGPVRCCHFIQPVQVANNT